MSPNGLNAPPAFAAITIFTQARLTNLGLSPATLSTTAHINKAVVRLSAIGEIKNDKIPVNQNRDRKLKPLPTIQACKASNNLRSSIALM